MLRVLLVDDSPLFLMALEDLLARIPDVAVIGRAYGAREGLLAAQRNPPDLILLDLMLPDRSGIDALCYFKAQVPAPLVVIMSVHDGSEYEDAAHAAGADGFVTKAEMARILPPLFESFNAGREWEDVA